MKNKDTYVNKILNLIRKKHNKQFLNALILFIGPLLFIPSSLQLFFSIIEDGCANEVQQMLLNKTDQLILAQNKLFEKNINAIREEGATSQEEAQAYSEEVVVRNHEYKQLIESIEMYSKEINERDEKCTSFTFAQYFFFIIGLIVLFVLIFFSWHFVNKYIEEEK